MDYLHNPYGEAFRRKASQKKALGAFMGAPTADEAKFYWDRARQQASGKSSTEAESLLESLRGLERLWDGEVRRIKESIVAAVVMGDQAEAASLGKRLLDGQTARIELEQLQKDLLAILDQVLAEFESTRPSDEVIAAMGYDLSDYGKDGYYTYGDDWFYKPGGTALYADEKHEHPICEVCGCSGRSWHRGCACDSPICGCSEED